ncbi:MAG: cation-transporting P-type ATPase [Opitutales bacterium]
MNVDVKDVSWHSTNVDEVLNRLESDPKTGLTKEEAEERLAVYGRNLLPSPPRPGPLKRFFRQFHNVLIYVLIVAAGVTMILEHWLDAGVILGVVVINALIGFIQEGKAERALDAIREMLSLEARCRRDGKDMTLPSEELVPGDIVTLSSGDRVPADMRLLKVKNLHVDEASLTGESQGAAKRAEPVGEDAVVGDQYSMAFSGTLITSGQGTGVVVGTGDNTELGRINRMLSEAEALTTPLLRQLAIFSRRLTVIIFALCLIAFLYGYAVRDMPFGEIFLAVVSVIVAAIPEGLPAIMTITLALGVQAMARRNSIIRRLPAVETLGSVTVICSDKTGTLTRNEMTAKTVVTANHFFTVGGSGYIPEGKVEQDGNEINLDQYPILREMGRVGFLCNEANLYSKGTGKWKLDGDPTEGALLTFGIKTGLNRDEERENFPRVDSIPFESEHRYMATLHRDPEGRKVIFLKGAPERVMEMSSQQRTESGDEPVDTDWWKEQFESVAAEGQRLLAVAMKRVPDGMEALETSDAENDLVFLGFFGLIDPPRQEVIHAIEECKSGGIRVKMITGDHAITAGSIARQLGIGEEGGVLVGKELEKMDEDELVQRALGTDVYARSSPEHKLRLVKALQKLGEIVAMTGDGVNDAPALKQANIGVAMGIKGTEVSKQASEMVLADDNFASITAAVKEGRKVYDNIRKAILFMLPTNAGQSLLILSAIFFGFVLPLTPVQVLWVNMVTTVTLAIALAFEPMEPDVMRRPPRGHGKPLLDLFGVWRVAFVGMLLLIASLGFFYWEREQGADIEFARTTAVNTLIVCQAFYLFNSRFIVRSSLSLNAFMGSRYALYAVGVIILLQLLFTYLPQMQWLFGTQSLPLTSWGIMIVLGIILFLLVELEKAVMRKWVSRQPHQSR